MWPIKPIKKGKAIINLDSRTADYLHQQAGINLYELFINTPFGKFM